MKTENEYIFKVITISRDIQTAEDTNILYPRNRVELNSLVLIYISILNISHKKEQMIKIRIITKIALNSKFSLKIKIRMMRIRDQVLLAFEKCLIKKNWAN